MLSKIYGLYDPSLSGRPVIRYIGFTKRPLYVRLSQHIHEAKFRCKNHRHKWIRSLLDKDVSPAIVVIELVDDMDWQERERFWITQFDSLVNGTDGGEGGLIACPETLARMGRETAVRMVGNTYRKGVLHSEEIRAKISCMLRASDVKKASDAKRKGRPGRKLTDEERAHLSRIKTGKKHPPRSDEWREKQRLAQTGRKHSAETKQKMSEKQRGNKRSLGRKQTEEVKRRISETRRSLRWITDGIASKAIPAGTQPPEGWRFGRPKRNSQ